MTDPLVYSDAMDNDIPEELRDRRTPAERDESSAGWYSIRAIELGIHYYIAGRYSMFSQLTPMCGTQMHHAVELLLKGCLARRADSPKDARKIDTWHEILQYGSRKTYAHDLEKLWPEFRVRFPDASLAAHDDLIAGLNKFETIRYPEQVMRGGALLAIGLYEVPEEQRSRPVQLPGRPPILPESRRFYLELPRVDRLVQALWQAGGLSRAVALGCVRDAHAARYLWLDNATPIVIRGTV